MTDRRVAVTGIGLLCAVGSTREQAWRALVDGRCGMRPISLFDTSGYRSAIAAEIPEYGVDSGYSPRQWQRMSRSDQVGVLAAAEALADAQLEARRLPPERVGVVLG